ncbi:MAG: rhodanese-like domain-containing protein [Acidimicrobiia bacterium]
MEIPFINIEELAERLETETPVVIDVREEFEWDEARIAGTKLVPLGELTRRVDELPTDQALLILCRSGNRSGQATAWLREQGYDAFNVDGGVLAWASSGRHLESGPNPA